MKTRLKLILFVLNEQNFKYSILSLEPLSLDLPSINLEQHQDIDNSLNHLMMKYINHYIEPKLIDVQVSELVDIFYYCIVPFNPGVKHSYLLDLEKYEPISKNIRKIWQSLNGKNF